MSFPGFRESYLLAQFREFYKEILRLKLQIQTPVAGGASEDEANFLPGRAMTTQAVNQALLSALENQALEAERSGGAFAYEVYREAQYVFAVLADEVFLNLDWDGSKDWPLLESKLFETHVSGEFFFEKLDRLLNLRDPAYQDLAAVFFMALALGFKGKYRGTEHSAHLDRYRQELFLMIFHQPPHLLGKDVRLFPQSYLHTLREGGRRKLPDPRNWLLLIPAVILVWLLLSTVMWQGLSHRIDSTLCRVNVTACTDSSGGR